MIFNNDTKEELNKMAKHIRIKVTYYEGYIIMFDKVNIHAITPHMLKFSKNGEDLILLHYDEYHENNNLYPIVNEKEPFTIGSMKKYVREYFGKIYKMKCNRNDN